MISIMTNEGALEIGRALSGGSRFLVWEAALLSENFDGMTAEAVAEISSSSVDLEHSLIATKHIAHRFDCTGSLPVKVSSDNGGNGTSAVAVDFDFSGQVPINEGGANVAIEYSAVVALSRRYSKYMTVMYGMVYNMGDHVWLQGDSTRNYAYVCLEDGFVYDNVPPDEDTGHWMAVPTSTLIKYPGEPDFYCDPERDIIPFFITSYDDAVTMANGMEWEYKVRVFLDNFATTDLSELKYFAKGGLEANGSLMLAFLANTAEMFRAIREKVSTAS